MLLSRKLPAGSWTCSTGTDALEEVLLPPLPGAGAFVKGSATNARLASPFCVRSLERPHLELIKGCVEDFDWVAAEKGSVVLVERPYSDASELAVMHITVCAQDTYGSTDGKHFIYCTWLY